MCACTCLCMMCRNDNYTAAPKFASNARSFCQIKHAHVPVVLPCRTSNKPFTRPVFSALHNIRPKRSSPNAPTYETYMVGYIHAIKRAVFIAAPPVTYSTPLSKSTNRSNSGSCSWVARLTLPGVTLY